MPAPARGFKTTLCAAFFTVLPAIALPAHAANAPTPGEVESTLPQQDRFPADDRGVPPLTDPQRPDRSVPAGGQPVMVREIEIVGNYVVSDEELARVVRPYIGQSLTLTDIYGIADSITAYYQKQGYGLASATVPAQRIGNGMVTLEVIEGRIASVSTEGNQRYDESFLVGQVDQLPSGEVYRSDAMEEEMLRLNDLPGLTARAVIRPGEAYGTSDIVLRVDEDPSEYMVSVDNFGRETIGEVRLYGEAKFNGLRGRGDRLDASFLVSEDSLLKYYRIGYSMALGADGERLSISANRTDYEVGGPLAASGILGDSTNFRIGYSDPVVRSRSRNVVWGAALLYTDSESVAGNLPLSQTEITLLEVSYAFNRLSPNNALTSFSAVFTTNGQDATYSAPGVLTGDEQKGKLRLDFSHNAPISGDWAYLAKAALVGSLDALVDTQQFSLGGPGTVRGWGPSEARGDHGLLLTGELQYRMRVGDYPAIASVFLDYGRVIREVTGVAAVDMDRTDSLASWGAGFQFNPGGKYSFKLQVADPLGGHVPAGVNGDDDVQVWANVIAEF